MFHFLLLSRLQCLKYPVAILAMTGWLQELSDWITDSIGDLFESVFGQALGWITDPLGMLSASLAEAGIAIYNTCYAWSLGWLTENPINKYPSTWNLVTQLLDNTTIKGLASDVVICLFCINLLSYGISIHGKADLADVIKIFVRYFVALFFVTRSVLIIEGLLSTATSINAAIQATIPAAGALSGDYLPALTGSDYAAFTASETSVISAGLLASGVAAPAGIVLLVFNALRGLLVLVISLAGMLILVILGISIIINTVKIPIRLFLAVPFSGVFAGSIVADGRVTGAAKGYWKYVITIVLEFIAICMVLHLCPYIFQDVLSGVVAALGNNQAIPFFGIIIVWVRLLLPAIFANTMIGLVNQHSQAMAQGI